MLSFCKCPGILPVAWQDCRFFYLQPVLQRRWDHHGSRSSRQWKRAVLERRAGTLLFVKPCKPKLQLQLLVLWYAQQSIFAQFSAWLLILKMSDCMTTPSCPDPSTLITVAISGQGALQQEVCMSGSAQQCPQTCSVGQVKPYCCSEPSEWYYCWKSLFKSHIIDDVLVMYSTVWKLPMGWNSATLYAAITFFRLSCVAHWPNWIKVSIMPAPWAKCRYVSDYDTCTGSFLILLLDLR